MRRYTITVNDTTKVLDVESTGANNFRVQIDGRWVDVELNDHRDLAHSSITPVIQTRAVAPAPIAPSVPATPQPDAVGAVPSAPATSATPAPRASGGGRDKMTAPMPGVILTVETSVGAQVTRGQTLLVLEAMKMKNELKAPRDGVVAELYVNEGQQVKFGEFLLRFEGN